MSNPNNLKLNSDLPTLKNDSFNAASRTMQVTVPGSVVVAPGTESIYSQDLVIGTIGSIIRATITNSKDNKTYVAKNILEQQFAVSPIGAIYNTTVEIYRKDANTMTLRVSVINDLFPPISMTSNATSETITAIISTFLSPFN